MLLVVLFGLGFIDLVLKRLYLLCGNLICICLWLRMCFLGISV